MIDWNSFHTWQLVMPPSRPSEEQIMKIRLLIKEVERTLPVAVLGSTPEFRDLYQEMGFKKIYIFDKNRNFYLNSKSLMKYMPENETLIGGDWLETIPECKTEFAVILSDLTMGNIEYDKRDAFYTAINRALRQDGIFIDKVLMHDFFLNVESLLTAYEHKPLNLKTANEFNCEMLFCSQLLQARKIIDTTEIYTYLASRKEYPWLEKLLELTKKVTPEGCVWYYGKERKEIEPLYINHFKLLNKWEEPIDSPYYLFVHHYLLTKKE